MFDESGRRPEAPDPPAPALTDSARLGELLALVPAARSTTEFVRLNIRLLAPGERADLLAMLEEQRNWLDSVQVRVLAEIGATDPDALGTVGVVLKLPPRAAESRLRWARALVRELPRTLALVTRGDISVWHAGAIADAAARMAPENVPSFETWVLQRAGRQSLAQLQRSARLAAIAFDPPPGPA